MSDESGQTTVELTALLPLLVVLALGIYAVLAAHAASEQAGTAAEAGAPSRSLVRVPDRGRGRVFMTPSPSTL